MQELSVVISGFDPYEGIAVNPALIVPDTLAEEGIAVDPNDFEDPLHGVDVRIHAVHMPVSFGKAWPMLNETLDRVHPHIVIATGLKQAARGILLERCAINLKDTTTRADRRPTGPACRCARSSTRSPPTTSPRPSARTPARSCATRCSTTCRPGPRASRGRRCAGSSTCRPSTNNRTRNTACRWPSRSPPGATWCARRRATTSGPWAPTS